MRDRSTRGALLTLAVALALTTAACTKTGPRDLPDVSVPSATDGSSSPASEASGARAENRLVVIDADGNLATIRPDGSDPIALTAGGGDIRYIQPTWSPDGRRVAWSEVNIGGDAPEATLVTSGFDGTGRTEAPTAVTAFYLSWDPTSSRVAYLGATGTALEMGVVDIDEGGGEATPLDSGQPFYLSWAPGGDRLLVHVGTDRLERIGLDGSVTSLADRPGSFQAPVWSGDGESLVYALRRKASQRLVASDPNGDGRRNLVEFDGIIRFVLSADSARLAYQILGNQPGDPGFQALSVIDLETGETETVTRLPVIAFFWSPAGDRLLLLVAETDEAGEVWFRWQVWDEDGTLTTDRFRPSLTFGRDYLPFFDQYAQSMSLWAPDGSAFAYAGVDEAGRAGVFVQQASPDTPPALVSPGVFAAWSPG